MKIMLPEGFQMPASAKPGEPFEAVATLVLDDAGEVKLSALDGVELMEEEEDEAMEEEEDEAMEEEEVYADPEITMPFE
jgi:hypothetical protein